MTLGRGISAVLTRRPSIGGVTADLPRRRRRRRGRRVGGARDHRQGPAAAGRGHADDRRRVGRRLVVRTDQGRPVEHVDAVVGTRRAADVHEGDDRSVARRRDTTTDTTTTAACAVVVVAVTNTAGAGRNAWRRSGRRITTNHLHALYLTMSKHTSTSFNQ